jgi:hypothetical protein
LYCYFWRAILILLLRWARILQFLQIDHTLDIHLKPSPNETSTEKTNFEIDKLA